MTKHLKFETNVVGFVQAGTLQEKGIGEYPYLCETSEKYPNDMVYNCIYDNGLEGGWTTLRDWVLGSDGIYRAYIK